MRPGPVLVLALAAALCGTVFAPSPASAQEEAPVPPVWIPWEGGTVWRYAYGPHTASSNVLDALDFQPPDAAGKQCEVFTSAYWAVAVADGRAIVLQNAIEIDHGGGFRTGYFHLADKQVRTGDEVRAGQRLGRPGCCPDGGTGTSCWSTDPHLHFYTATNGARRHIAGTLIGGWLVGADGCLTRGPERACPGSSMISNTPRSEGTSLPPPIDVTVALDVSGSVRGVTEAGEAQRLVAPYLEEASRGAGVSLISFNSHARVLFRPGEKRPVGELTEMVGSLMPDGNTDLAAGLALACREMQARGTGARQALVLITDGVHNAGRLRDPEHCFAERGWQVFAYGVGHANSNFLERLAQATGGEYRAASAIFDPACEFERLRTLTNGLPLSFCSRYLLRPGETLSVPLTVPPQQREFALSLAWVTLGRTEQPASLKAHLRMPGGHPLPAEGPLLHEQTESSERYAVPNPAAGAWQVMISGHGVPSAGVLFTLSFGTTPIVPIVDTPTETPIPIAEEAPSDATYSETPTPEATDVPEQTISPTPGWENLPSQTPRKKTTPSPTPTASPDATAIPSP